MSFCWSANGAGCVSARGRCIRGANGRCCGLRLMEAARFERTVRTESSEIFAIYGGARRVGRVDLHYGRFEVNATLLLEVDLTDDELQQLIDQLDEELVQNHDPKL